MKNILLYIGMAAMLLNACSKEEQSVEQGQNLDGTFTFNLVLDVPDDEKAAGATAKATTRATVTMGRYLLEMYEGDLTAIPLKQSSSDGTFKVKLKDGVDYICLFWADGGEADYTATDLKAVKQTTPTDAGKPAYFASVTTNAASFSGSVSLKRAVAEVRYVETVGFSATDNVLKVKYPIGDAAFNVSDGTVANFGTGAEVTRTFTALPAPSTGGVIATDYLLAPVDQANMPNIKFQMNAEAEKRVVVTPLQANFKTNIKGEYGPVVYVGTEAEFADEWKKAEDSGGDFIVTLKNDITLSDNDYSDELLEGKIIIHGNYTLNLDAIMFISKPIVFNCKVEAAADGGLMIQSGGSYTPKSADDFICPVLYDVTTDAEFIQAMNDPNSVQVNFSQGITLTSTGNLSNTDVKLVINDNMSLTIPTGTTLSVGALTIGKNLTVTGGTINATDVKFDACTIAANTTINCSDIATSGNSFTVTNNGTITYLTIYNDATLGIFQPNQPTKRP